MSGNRRHREFQDWSETGDFLKKPKGGWLHTSDQLNPHAGVCYSATVCTNQIMLEIITLVGCY